MEPLPNIIGLSEFVVMDINEDPDGRSVVFNVEPVKPPSFCPHCGVISPKYKHSKNIRRVQHLNFFGRLSFLDIHTGRYKCQDCKSTFYEMFDCIDGKDNMTMVLREDIIRRCLSDSFSRVALDYSVSVNTIRSIFMEYAVANEHLLLYKAPRVLGIDEAHLNKVMRGVICDTENKLLLDILPERRTPFLTEFLKRMSGYENVEVVTIDMYRPYRAIVKEVFPYAKIVIDKFHVVKLLNKAIDVIRIYLGNTGTDYDKYTLGSISMTLKRNQEDLDYESRKRLEYRFKKYPDLEAVYVFKEEFRKIYKCETTAEAKSAFVDWCENVMSSPKSLRPMKRACGTLKWWAEEIFNYFDHRFTNAFTESMNNKIKDIDKLGRSLEFEQLRYKVLFSTRATKLPRFYSKQVVYAKSNTFGITTPDMYKMLFALSLGDFFELYELEQGFGVDIETVLKELGCDVLF